MVTVTSPFGAICTKADGCCVGFESTDCGVRGLGRGQLRKRAEDQAAGTGQLRKLRRGNAVARAGLAAGRQVLQSARHLALIEVGQHGGSFRRGCERRPATAARMRA